jgi:hypothetical protein
MWLDFSASSVISESVSDELDQAQIGPTRDSWREPYIFPLSLIIYALGAVTVVRVIGRMHRKHLWISIHCCDGIWADSGDHAVWLVVLLPEMRRLQLPCFPNVAKGKPDEINVSGATKWHSRSLILVERGTLGIANRTNVKVRSWNDRAIFTIY